MGANDADLMTAMVSDSLSGEGAHASNVKAFRRKQDRSPSFSEEPLIAPIAQDFRKILDRLSTWGSIPS